MEKEQEDWLERLTQEQESAGKENNSEDAAIPVCVIDGLAGTYQVITVGSNVQLSENGPPSPILEPNRPNEISEAVRNDEHGYSSHIIELRDGNG